MNNKELLELAAKAIGMPLNCQDGWNWVDNVGIEKDWGLWKGVINPTISNPNPRPYPVLWNPMTRNSDAFALAVILRMSVTIFEDAIGIGIEDCGYEEYPIEVNHENALRLAITKAALKVTENLI